MRLVPDIIVAGDHLNPSIPVCFVTGFHVAICSILGAWNPGFLGIRHFRGFRISFALDTPVSSPIIGVGIVGDR
jgi:hypothetical protein